MKLYNPFKAHIVELASGKFAVRSLSFLLGWRYANRRYSLHFKHWVYDLYEYVEKYCPVDSLDEAIALLNKVNHEDVNPMKVVKVHG